MSNDISNSQHPTANRHAFPVGSKVRVAEKHTGAGPAYGVKQGVDYTVVACYTNHSGFMVDVVQQEGDRPNKGFGSDWFVLADAPKDRDHIPFTLTKDTAKDYARRSNSTKLDQEHRQVLAKAANGQEVDAWDFHLAATAALSLAATRAGQSMGRREYTKMARHLLYISGAVISNSLRGLPPVDPGTRSPKIAEQAREIEDLRATVQRLAAEAQQATQKYIDADHRVGLLISEKTDAEAYAASLSSEAEEAYVILGYIKENLLTDVQRAQVSGFVDGLHL